MLCPEPALSTSGPRRGLLRGGLLEAEATKLRGEADAAAMRVKIEAAGGVDGYTRQLQAQAALNWKGTLPQIIGVGSAQLPIERARDTGATPAPAQLRR
jgi:hypothetical protein